MVNGYPFRPINRDKLLMFPRDLAVMGAHNVLHYLNRLEGEELVASLSVLFAAVVQRAGVASPHECYSLGDRMLRHEDYHQKANDALQSLRDFAGIQVKGDQNVSIA